MESRTKKKSVFAVGEIFNSFDYDNDKAFRMAVFNGIAILIVIVVAITTSGIYFILQPFLKPLLWALLCGSVLHPFKAMLAEKLRIEVMKLENDSRPFYVTAVFLPFSVIFKISDTLGDFLVTYRFVVMKIIGGLCCLMIVYFYVPNLLFQLNNALFAFNWILLDFVLNTFGNTYVFVLVVLGFLSGLHFLWTPGGEGNSELYSYMSSAAVWLSASAWLSNYFGYLRLPVFVLIQGIVFGSYVHSLFFKNSMGEKENVSDDENDVTDNQSSESPKEEFSSLHYIKWLFYICFAVLLVSIPSFLYIFLLMLILYAVKHICIDFGLFDLVSSHAGSIFKQMESWFELRKHILYPSPLKESYSVLKSVRKRLLLTVRDSCDSAAAVIVILALLFLGAFSSVFLTLQAYREGVYLIQVGGDVLNKTIIQNPEVHQLLPDDWKSTAEAALNDAYLYARDVITTMVRSALKNRGLSDERTRELELGALELWDRAYQAWLMPIQPSVGPVVTPDAVLASCNSFIERLQKTPEVMSVGWVKDLVKENMELLTSGLDSAWTILRGNMTLLLGITSTLFSILFGGGISLINFTINSIVFLTSLYYLLSTSRLMYKPVELITHLSPKYGKKLALAVENSCREVLAASAKLSMFYGLWTWLIHKIFQSNLAYVPAVFAGILGVVPVFGTYWVCVPAMIDLWFVQESRLRALGLFIAQIFPTAIVETVIYNEIEGGHPYLTGLSVAGGIFWLGIEGAIVGPLLLCLLFITLNILSGQQNTIPPPDSSQSTTANIGHQV